MSVVACCAVQAGCGTTIQKTGTEQLLLSEAVDNAIDDIDFSSLSGRRVYLDRAYLQTMQTNNVVDANYVVSGLRQQLLAAGCMLQDSRDDADVIVEPRVGSLGTDGHEVLYGIPQSSAINTAANAFSALPIPVMPEIALGKSNANQAVAKVAVFAYDKVTRQPIWQSGSSRAQSTSRSTWVFGIGPFQRGSIYRGLRFAGSKIQRDGTKPIPEHLSDHRISFRHEYNFPQPRAEARVAQILNPDQAKEEKGNRGGGIP